MSGPWIAAFAALCAVVLLLVLIVVGTLRRISSVLESAEARLGSASPPSGGLSTGDPIPDFEATTTNGSKFTVSDLNGSASILLFLSGGCVPCRMLADELTQGNAGDLGARLIVVLNDPRDRLELGLPSGAEVIYQADGSLSRAFRVSGTPHAVAIAQRTVWGSRVANSLLNLRDLAYQLRREVSETDEPTDKRPLPEMIRAKGGPE